MVVGTFCRGLIVRPEVTVTIVNDFIRRETLTKILFPFRNKKILVGVSCTLVLCAGGRIVLRMHRFLSSTILLALVFPAGAACGVSKPLVIGFGKWTTVKWCAGAEAANCVDLQMRALYVDGRAREFTLSAAHDITERLFVVRRAFRVNDNLPGDTAATRWVWQRGGWLLVDRMTGRISALALPEFDPYYLFLGQLVSRLRRLLRRFR
jgi:hypothetical protein